MAPQAITSAFSLTDLSQLRAYYYWAPDNLAEITPVLMSIDWEESKDVVSRTFTFTLDNYYGHLGELVNGGVITLEYGPVGTEWVEWFRGTVITDSDIHDSQSGTKTLRCQDAMRYLNKSTGSFNFKNGVTASDSIRTMLERLEIPIGEIEDTTVKLPGLTYQGSYYDAIQVLLLKTRQGGGRRFLADFDEGKFWLTRYFQPVWVYDVQSVVAQVNRERSIEEVVTRIVLKGKKKTTIVLPGKTLKSGKTGKSRKRKSTTLLSATAQANAVKLAAFGIIEVTDDMQDTNTDSEKVQKAAQQRLARLAQPTDTLQLQLSAECPTLRRLHPIKVDNDPVTQANGLYYVSALNGRLAPSEFSLTVDCTRAPEFPDAPTDSLAFTSAHKFPGDTADRKKIALWMAGKAEAAGLPRELPVMAALAESNMSMDAVGDKGLAIGYFQIHPEHGTDAQRKDPEWQLSWFVDKATAQAPKFSKLGASSYGHWIQAVEISATSDGSQYQSELGNARALLAP